MAVGVQVPPSAPSKGKAPLMGLFFARKKGLCSYFLERLPSYGRQTQLISVRAFQTIPMLLFGQFLHISDGIALIDNFFTEQCL